MDLSNNNQNDLDQVIEDSLNDSLTDTSVTDDVVVTEPDTQAPEESVDEAATETGQVKAPGATEEPTAPEDEFAKKFGLQAQSVTGRENRIPYSRVKKIVAKAEKDATEKLRKELEGQFTPKSTEYETKIKDYESRLGRVAEYEQILDTKPKEFLGMLAKHPAYQEFFQFVEKAAATLDNQPAVQEPAASSDMPTPDLTYPDGTQGFSREGLDKLLAWHASKVEGRVTQQIEQRYKPIEQEWQSREQQARMIPVVEKQIAEARTWDHFNELEPRVIEILNGDRNINLDRAYMKAYQEYVASEREKLSADRNKMRTDLISEMKKKPIASSAPAAQVVRSSNKQLPQEGDHNRVTSVIEAALEEAGLKMDR